MPPKLMLEREFTIEHDFALLFNPSCQNKLLNLYINKIGREEVKPYTVEDLAHLLHIQIHKPFTKKKLVVTIKTLIVNVCVKDI